MNRVGEERQHWDGLAQDPDLDQKYIADFSIEETLEALGEIYRGIILDLGCGVGRISIEVAKNNCQVIGYDISEKMVEIARQRSKKLFYTRPLFFVNDGRTIPEKDELFDSAYSILLFQHLPEEGITSYIREVFRVLKSGGRFRFQFIEGDEHEPYSHHYELDKMVAWLTEAGFTTGEIDKGLVHDQWTWVTAVKP